MPPSPQSPDNAKKPRIPTSQHNNPAGDLSTAATSDETSGMCGGGVLIDEVEGGGYISHDYLLCPGGEIDGREVTGAPDDQIRCVETLAPDGVQRRTIKTDHCDHLRLPLAPRLWSAAPDHPLLVPY
jgi:hypothetical protein